MNAEMQKWVEQHLKDDPIRLRLKYGGDREKDYLIMQIECRRKSSSKLRQTLGCAAFEFPTALSAEQCTSDLLADFHASLIDEGNSVLDLTFGLGIDAFHLARRAKFVDGIEKIPEVAEVAARNAASLGLDNIRVAEGDSVEKIKGIAPDSYDVIFVDPARRGDDGRRLFALSDCSPDVVALLSRLLAIAPKVIVKASPMLDVTMCLRELPGTSDLYVIGTPAECKEIVAVVKRGFTDDPVVHSVTITAKSIVDFTSRAGKAYPQPRYGDPCAGWVLYEPWPAVMKAGVMPPLSQAFPDLLKLQGNTHLFTSDEPVRGFPGGLFRIQELYPFSSSAVKGIARRKIEADITVRNFPYTAQDMMRRLRLIPRGPQRLFAATSVSGPVMMLCVPIEYGEVPDIDACAGPSGAGKC